jgi:hypothetical protein
MTLHSKARGDDLDGQYLSINPLYAREGEGVDVPRHHMPDSPMLPQMAYEIIRDELMLDGNARLNLATFVTTWMEPEASPHPAHEGHYAAGGSARMTHEYQREWQTKEPHEETLPCPHRSIVDRI